MTIIVAKEQACQFHEATKCNGMYKGFVKMQEKQEYHFVQRKNKGYKKFRKMYIRVAIVEDNA